jgi:hypothetical protein
MELTLERGARGDSLMAIGMNSVPFVIRSSLSSKHELEEKSQKKFGIRSSIEVIIVDVVVSVKII